jgi:predicted ArsR family transcriptional regulator
MDDEYGVKILYALANSGRLCFQEIVKKTQMQRNKAQETLKCLIEKREVQEENKKDWKRGQKLFFKLTDKGKNRIVEAVTGNIKNQVEILDASPATIQSLDEAIANEKEDPGFKQVLKAIRDYGKDKVGVHIPPEDKTSPSYKRREERKKKGLKEKRPDSKA